MKENSEMARVMETEDGFLTIETQKVISMKDNIATTKRVDLDCTNGRMELSIKANSLMT